MSDDNKYSAYTAFAAMGEYIAYAIVISVLIGSCAFINVNRDNQRHELKKLEIQMEQQEKPQ